MLLFGRKRNHYSERFLKSEQEFVNCIDLLYRLLDQLYSIAEKVTELTLLVQDRELKKVKLPEELKHSLNDLRRLVDLLVTRCC